MRLTSGIWVAALVRRCNGAGAAAFVVKRGAAEAGAVYVTVDRLNGEIDLYGPAPQSVFSDERPSDRRFERLLDRASDEAVNERLASERRFDSDLWIIAVEDRDGRSFLDSD
ncbi:MAG: DUF1491 family protein [Alphaproteobacteria bacterium]